MYDIYYIFDVYNTTSFPKSLLFISKPIKSSKMSLTLEQLKEVLDQKLSPINSKIDALSKDIELVKSDIKSTKTDVESTKVDILEIRKELTKLNQFLGHEAQLENEKFVHGVTR